jgi:phage-related protein
MKSVNNTLRSLVTVVLIIVLSVVTASVNATENKPAKSETPVDVKYVGTINYQPVLQIQFDNETEEEVTVTLRDEDGTYLYSETFNGKKYSKKFQFEKPADTELNVQLVITTKSRKDVQVYNINKNTRFVEDVVISKVK